MLAFANGLNQELVKMYSNCVNTLGSSQTPELIYSILSKAATLTESLKDLTITDIKELIK